MLRQTWNAYRGWAKLARDLQTRTQQWNLAAIICVIAAAIFGAAASFARDSWWGTGAASIATLASALGAFLGRQIVGAGDEYGWIQARAVAEGIKSECYRYVARCGVYAVADADAAKALAARTAEIVKKATDKGLVRADDPVPDSGDKREPPNPLTTDWYKVGRIQDQIKYYRDARERHQEAAGKVWWVAFFAGFAAVIFGALGAWAQRFAPLIGATTTIVASIAAYSLIDRRKYLIGSYAAMQSCLEQILGLDAEDPMKMADLVTTTENLLESEHQMWLPQMLALQNQPQTHQQSKQGARVIQRTASKLG
jgi:hypothetical protein